MSQETTVSVAPLFESVPFGEATLRNRVVMAPMARGKSPGCVPGEDVAAYYRRRAEGGVGLIITEGTSPNHKASSGSSTTPAFFGDTALEGWKRVVDGVHGAGGRIIPQLWHVGSMRQPAVGPNPEVPAFAPSAVMHPSFAGKGEVPVEMTQADIDEVVASFAEAAKQAEAVGFDGVELHGAHSYLIDQFFWSATNRRADRYGGDLIQRTRFAVEVIEAVRANVSAGFPVVFRFSQWKQGDYRHKLAETPKELERFLSPLADAGVDYFHASTRRFNDPEFPDSNLNLAGWAQQITGKPAITVGSVGLDNDFLRTYDGKEANKVGVDDLIRRLENKEFELVAVGRALLSDPAWADKVRDRKESEIVAFDPAHMAVLT